MKPTHPAVTPETTPLWWRAYMAGLSLIVTLALVRGVWALADGFEQAPISSASGYPQTLAVDWSGFPVASPLAFPARMEMVMLEPTPTRTPVVPTKVPTQSPFLCPDNPDTLPNGETCLGPAAPVPTPTPLPTCQVPPVPSQLCEVRNSIIGQSTPRPTSTTGPR